MKRTIKIFILIIITGAFLTGCVPGDGSYTTINPAGFLSGIWHGWIAPITLIYSFIDRSKSIYEAINTGFWYDFGFYMAIISGFGGISLSRKKERIKYRNRR